MVNYFYILKLEKLKLGSRLESEGGEESQLDRILLSCIAHNIHGRVRVIDVD